MRAPRRAARRAGTGGWCRAGAGSTRGAPERGVIGKPPAGLFAFWWALRPIFVWRAGLRAPKEAVPVILRERLSALIEPLLGRLGVELVELQYASGHARAVLRLFIDAPAGVSLQDCERVSREVASLLDVEDPIPCGYTLEVSSPGFDRLLRTRAHFGRFVGSRVFVELKEPRAGRRRYTGTLLTVDEGGIALEVDRERVAM